jgi:hypothetical protein
MIRIEKNGEILLQTKNGKLILKKLILRIKKPKGEGSRYLKYGQIYQ